MTVFSILHNSFFIGVSHILFPVWFLMDYFCPFWFKLNTLLTLLNQFILAALHNESSCIDT